MFGYSGINFSRIPKPSRALVCQVAADDTMHGVVYAEVQHDSCGTGPHIIYESMDYGQHWQKAGLQTLIYGDQARMDRVLRASGEDLWYENKWVWSLPKHTFRQFFGSTSLAPFSSYAPHDPITIPYYISPDGQDIIYAPLGVYGVLVGPASDSKAQSWGIVHEGIDGIISPLKLNNPLTVLIVIALGLLIPPLTILHAWLIAQAYRYAYPMAEQQGAYALALKVSGVITGLAAVAIYIWLTNEVVDYYLIVGMMTAITLLLSAGTGVWIAHKRGFSTAFTLRMAFATADLALIVPIGVASTLYRIGWPIILTLVIGFIVYRASLTRYLEREAARTTLWQLDRLALELLLTFLVMLVPIGLLVLGINQLLDPRNGVISLLETLTVPIGSVVCVALYITVRGRGIIIKKVGTLKTDFHESPLFWNMRWWRTLFWRTATWLIGSLIVFYVVSLSQMLVYLWFGNLGSY